MFDKITVQVPATSANLGAGFDTLGIALKVYNYFDLEYILDGIETVGLPEPYCGKNNLVYKSLEFILARGGHALNHGLKITSRSNIPFGSGLGSSATCIVAGLIMGNYLLKNKFSKDELLDFAVEIEGHGDNVTPCLFGGLTVFINHDRHNYYQKINVASKIKLGILISDQEKISTKELRKSIPEYIKIEDAIYNLSHLASTIVAFESGNKEMLKISMDDKIHEQARSSFIKNYENVKEKAEELNVLSVNVSGAGPSVLVVYDEKFQVGVFEDYIKALPNNWKFIECGIDNLGGYIC